MYTDAWIMHSSVRAANQHNGTIFFYLFDYRGNLTFPNYFGITEDYGMYSYMHDLSMSQINLYIN